MEICEPRQPVLADAAKTLPAAICRPRPSTLLRSISQPVFHASPVATISRQAVRSNRTTGIRTRGDIQGQRSEGALPETAQARPKVRRCRTDRISSPACTNDDLQKHVTGEADL